MRLFTEDKEELNIWFVGDFEGGLDQDFVLLLRGIALQVSQDDFKHSARHSMVKNNKEKQEWL